MVTVRTFESERGWGQKTLRTRHFNTMKEAEAFCDEYNKDNNKPVTPDYYTKAEIIDEEDLKDQ